MKKLIVVVFLAGLIGLGCGSEKEWQHELKDISEDTFSCLAYDWNDGYRVQLQEELPKACGHHEFLWSTGDVFYLNTWYRDEWAKCQEIWLIGLVRDCHVGIITDIQWVESEISYPINGWIWIDDYTLRWFIDY